MKGNGMDAQAGWIPMCGVVSLCAIAGCQLNPPVEPALVPNRWLGPARIAVAPALNLSGSTDFDPAGVADLMASELSFADGISVVPVSRVLGELAKDGADRVRSPEHALSLCERLGADVILVFAVTVYDAFDPPRVGISAQLHGRIPLRGGGRVDPMTLSRQGNLVASPGQASARGLLAETERVFDASHDFVIENIRRFAAIRSADNSPYGWRRYVVSQRDFVRYCCHATIRSLLYGQYGAVLRERHGKRVGMP